MTHCSTLRRTLLATALVASLAAPALPAADSAAKYTIKEVMKALHKGDVNVGKKVLNGKGDAADFAKLVDCYESLPLNKPPRGEQASWDAKTGALVKSAKSLKAGEAGALEAYKAAANCKACHTEHKPMDKK